MRLWWEVGRRSFRRYASYRAATWAGIFTNSIFGFIRAYVFVAMFALAPAIARTYDLADALTYTFLTQGMLMPLYIWGWTEIADTIVSGQVVTDLYRPFDYQFYWLAQDLGRASYHGLARGIPPFVIGAAFFELRVPTSLVTWVAFAVSFALAVAVAFAMRFMVNLSAFWLFDIKGVHSLSATAWTFLSGFSIPIALFPDGARELVWTLPFVAMVEIPMNVFLERSTGPALAGALALQAFWAAVLLGAGRLMLAAATRRVVIQGG